MAALSISTEDLEPFASIPEEKAEAMIEDAMAMASLVAPCITEDDLDPKKAAAAKAVIRGAILRWHESGTGAAVSQTALGFSQTLDTRQERRGMYWPSEIEQLQKICQAVSESSGAWSYDTAGSGIVHAETCSLVFGANYCDCGAILTGLGPLWEPSQ